MAIACVAVIGKDNEPLYIKTFADSKQDSGLRFHYHVHTSLDVIDEKLNASKKSGAPMSDLFLGLLFSVEDFRVYGYVTNTRIKFVVVLKDIVGDTHVRSWFRELHTLFVATMSNPFSSLNTKIESTRFDQQVTRLALSYEKKTAGTSVASTGMQAAGAGAGVS